jgi:hypothetical protein
MIYPEASPPFELAFLKGKGITLSDEGQIGNNNFEGIHL